MKKLILVGLLALSFTGCLHDKEEKIISETVVIKNGCYYYLKEGNTTVYDMYCTNYDINCNGKIVVSYKVEEFGANIIKVEDDKIEDKNN